MATIETSTSAAGFIPAATLDNLRDVLATVPVDIPNSADALGGDVLAYADYVRKLGVVTLRASDSLTAEFRTIAAEICDSDAGEVSARNNSARVALTLVFNISRNGQSASAWARVYYNANNAGVMCPLYGGAPCFDRGGEPTYYDDSRGRFMPLPAGAMKLVLEHIARISVGVPATGDDIARAAWLAHSQRAIREGVRVLSRGLEMARLSAAHYA